jgi:hypothetical protein
LGNDGEQAIVGTHEPVPVRRKGQGKAIAANTGVHDAEK